MISNVPDEKVVIVDEHDRPIGSMWRKDRTHDDIYRVAALWLTNSRGQILLAQRSLNKDRGAGQWGPAAAGTVAEGETYLENIIRETEEEIGLKGVKFNPGPKLFTDTGKYRSFSQFFTASVNQDISEFTLQEEEVAAVQWFERDQLLQDLQQNPSKFVYTSIYWPELFLS